MSESRLSHLPTIRTGPGAEMELPAEFLRLRELAYNLWWTWSPNAHRMFEKIDAEHWNQYRNPIELLINVTPERWTALRTDQSFCGRYLTVLEEFDQYIAGAAHSWFRSAYPSYANGPICYFSTEFGWHECLQSYSGGLGVLAGDHSKAASDLGLPFLGFGLLYRRGYFRQEIDFEGNQQHIYPDLDPSRLPVLPVVDDRGNELRVQVELPNGPVRLRLWRAEVGRLSVILLDPDVEENDEADRRIASVLYVQGREMRLCQEILLGLGGVRAVRALGVRPALWHINEGHSALLTLERIREELVAGGDFDGALQQVADRTLFTTHTPVPAGNETFEAGLIRRYFAGWAEEAGIDIDSLLELGRAHGGHDGGHFNLTALALRSSTRANGVSELHGRVARTMWDHLAGDGDSARPIPEIGHVTNGVHVATWLGGEMRRLLERNLGSDFLLGLGDPAFADAVAQIPGDELWQAHAEQRAALLRLVRARLLDQYSRYGRSPDELRALQGLLDPAALTIGFARRFATYKRASLVFRDPARLSALFRAADRPVQIVFAGKAHPADRPGQELIRRIHELSHAPEFQGRVVFLENYNMHVGRCLVQGVDLWLNTPRRPLEASGTSGMKAAINGVLNCSILDGWWCEGHDDDHGWAIGGDEHAPDEEQQDAADAEALYAILEDEIVPCFYERGDDGLPRAWLERMKRALGTLIPRFSASRMVREYAERHYFRH